LKLESNMKMKKVAVTAAVCAALLGSQGVMAEEQPIGAEGMDFAFDDAQVSSVQMSELSGAEMDATEGAWWPVFTGAVGGIVGGTTYAVTSPNPSWGGLAGSVAGGAIAGATGGTAGAVYGGGILSGGLNSGADAVNSGLGGGSW
jgi:hypothetical protein